MRGNVSAANLVLGNVLSIYVSIAVELEHIGLALSITSKRAMSFFSYQDQYIFYDLLNAVTS